MRLRRRALQHVPILTRQCINIYLLYLYFSFLLYCHIIKRVTIALERGVMKRNFLFLFAFMFCVPTALLAVSGCIKLNPDTVCTSVSGTYNHSDSRVDCNGNVLRFVGMCVQNTGTKDVSVRDYLTTSTTLTNNYRCWCMMAEPVPSKWALRAVYDDAAACRRQCNVGCKNAFLYNNDEDKTFRKTIMSNLIQ